MKHFGDLSLLTLPSSVFCQIFHGGGGIPEGDLVQTTYC